MNELPTEERCRKIMLSRIMPGEIQYFSDSERPAIKRWAEENGHDLLKMNDGETAARILSEHHGAPDTLPGRDEATGTEPKLALTAEERWHSQMNRSEAMIEKQEKLQYVEGQQQDRMQKILNLAETYVIKAIAKESEPTAADIERTQELGKWPAWEKSKAMIGTMPVKPETESAVPVGTVGARELDPINQAPSGQFPNIKRDQGFKLGGVGHVPIVPKEDYVITKTQTDAKSYYDSKQWEDRWNALSQELTDSRQIVEDQKAIIANLEKRLEAGRKRGQMVRDLLSKEL